MNSDNEELKQEVLSGEKSIHAGYKDSKDLIETNIRQRGEIGGSAKQVLRRIEELERIYGIRNGSAGGNGSNQYSKKEKMGLSL